MKITMLGCGTSVGIPALGRAGWGTCDPQNPKNRRQRCAILIQTKSTTILIDAGPDIRNQLLPMNISKLDAVLITHTHSDHVAGMDDLRVFYWPDQNKIKLFGSEEHGKDVLCRFPYLFQKNLSSPSYFIPPFEWNSIETDELFKIGDVTIRTQFQKHGSGFSLGFVFNEKFAYSTDVSELDDEYLNSISNIPIWIVETLRETPHSAHAHFDLTFSWIQKVKPAKCYLTHLGLESDYESLLNVCPPNVEPGYDGLVIEI